MSWVCCMHFALQRQRSLGSTASELTWLTWLYSVRAHLALQLTWLYSVTAPFVSNLGRAYEVLPVGANLKSKPCNMV